jgi:hypothetical protein
MGAIDEATEVLRAAERKLRALIVQAAEQGDYDHLALFAEWAKQVSAILDGPTTPAPPADPDRDGDEPLAVQPSNWFQPRAALPRGRSAGSRASTAGGGMRGRRTRKSKRKSPDYPKFLREGETLVKVGWSKRERKTYEHKAPRSVLQALVEALTRAGSGGERFTTENLFPLRDPADRSEIPDYQAYLTLAWLRGNGLLVQHGRQGYSLPEATDLTREIDQLWNSLPTR